MQPLGRLVPPDFDHVAKWPLAELGAAAPVGVPVTLGVNWYTSFDSPVERADGSFHLPDVSTGGQLGTVRGGHSFALEPMGAVKTRTELERVFYNQLAERACVGFAKSRALSVLHPGTLFDARWLYDQARAQEGRPTGEGSTVRAADEVLKTLGHRRQTGETVCTRDVGDGLVDLSYGIAAYRWATTVEEVCRTLARPGAQAVPLMNNWGDSYPTVVWMPVGTLDRLLAEEGEADVITAR